MPIPRRPSLWSLILLTRWQ